MKNIIKIAITKNQQLRNNILIATLSNDFYSQVSPRYFNDELIICGSKRLFKIFGRSLNKPVSNSELYFYIKYLLNKQLSKDQFKSILNKLINLNLVAKI